MSSMPKCRCGRVSVNREILKGPNRGRWFWKCAKNLCGFYELNDPGKSTYTFTSYTIPRGPSNRTFIRTPTSNEQHIDRTLLNLNDDSSSVISLGSVNDKSRTSRSRSKRQSELTNVRLALYTNTDICVDAQARHGYLQTIFNTIPEIAWLGNQRLWVFSADQQTYQRVWRLLQQHRGIFEVVGVPFAVLKYLPKTTQLLWEELQQDHQPQHAGIENDDSVDDLLGDWDFDIDNDNDNDNDDVDNVNSDGNGDDNNKERSTDNDATDITTATNNKIEWKLEDRIGESKLWRQMTAEQQSSLKKMIDMDGHVYLQDSAGSGNSLQALGVTLVHRDDWPVLIICRASVCQKWNTLIQDTLLLDQHQISILDRDPSLDSPKAIQYLQMRRKRERLKKQKEKVGMMGLSTISPFSSKASSSPGDNKGRTELDGKQTAMTKLGTGRQKGDLWIKILDNSGDTPPWRYPPTNVDASNNQPAINYMTYTRKKNPSNKKRKLQKNGDIFIKIVDNSGDYTSDTGTACIDDDDDDFMDSNDSDIGNTHCRNDMATSDATLKRTLRKGSNEINNQMIPGTTHFFIISYDKAKTKLGALSATECKIIIFDDCHDLNGTLLPTNKTPLQNLVNACKKTIMVSDIPILPKPMESFPLLQILKPNTFVDFRFFGQRYCGAKQTVFGWDYTGLSNSFELEFFLSKTVLVT